MLMSRDMSRILGAWSGGHLRDSWDQRRTCDIIHQARFALLNWVLACSCHGANSKTSHSVSVNLAFAAQSRASGRKAS